MIRLQGQIRRRLMSREDRYRTPQLFRYRFGSAEFDESRFALLVCGKVIEVQRKPLEFLALLLQHPGEVVTREELLEHVWDNRPTVEHVINNALAKLRAALGPENAARIATQPRVGFRFDGPLQRTPVGRAAHSELKLIIGTSVPGREQFILERMLGRSNDHEVWLARQARTAESRVYKFCVDGARLGGLKREATLARVLREELGPREDLVHLIDWNFETPPYYLESEYGGMSLREWANHPGGLAEMATHHRLELFLQIADAVGAAHSVGIIHKDLKPANILVRKSPHGWSIKVADFGSGGLLSPDRLAELGFSRLGFTLTQQHASDPDRGTPLYLAPEQLAGKSATMLSDVYALGLILFQLLTGDLSRPLAPGWQRDIIDPLLGEDIAAATDVDPSRRTGSASLLAHQLRRLSARREDADRQRLLDANRQALLMRERRAAERAPWIRTTIAILILGVSVAAVSYWRLRQTADLLQSQYDVVERLNRLLTKDMIGAANPDRGDVESVTVPNALRLAARQIDVEFPTGPYAIRGALHAAMQNTLSGLSDYPHAIDEGRAAVRDFQAAGLPAADERMLKGQLRLASDLANVSRYDEARRVLELAEGTIELRRNPLLNARAEFVRGRIAQNELKFDQAIAAFEDARELAKATKDTDLIDRIEYSLGTTLTNAGRLGEADIALRALLAQQSRDFGPESARAQFTRSALAQNLTFQERYAEAEPLLVSTAARVERAFGKQHRYTLDVLQLLASLEFKEEHYLKAAAMYGEIYARFTEGAGKNEDFAVSMGLNQATALQLAGHTQDAVPILRQQLGIARQFLPETAPRLEALRYHLADCELDLRHSTAEVGSLLHGLTPEIVNASQQEPDWEGRIDYQKGRLALLEGRRRDAREFLERALVDMTAHDSGGHIKPQDVRDLLSRL